MSFVFSEIVKTLQFILLRVIYDNFDTIVHAGHREIIRQQGVGVTIVRFRNGLRVTMRRDERLHYFMDFENVPYPQETRGFTIKLGKGKNLVNHRVMNDVGVRLNAFLGDSAYSSNKSLMMRFALDWASKDLRINVPSWFSRFFGTTTINHNGGILSELPHLTVRHTTDWKWLEGNSKVKVEVELLGGVRETIYMVPE